MRLPRLCALLALVACSGDASRLPEAAPTPPTDGDPEAGRRIFLEGVLSSGKAVQATVLGDVSMTGEQVTCRNCHGRSGMGTEERGNRSPPITGELLLTDDRLGLRPAYTPESLYLAVTGGLGADGSTLDPLMPRYALSKGDFADLFAYLDTLGTRAQPGIDRENLHLATVVSVDLPEARRDAYLDVLQAFVDSINAQSRNDRERAEARRQKGRAYDPYRTWTLHVWEVDGDPSEWPEQLDDHLEAHPVFAMVGGLAESDWSPVHAFCDQQQMPCLFPSTDLAPDPGASFHSLYFSGGLETEAAVMAHAISKGGGDGEVVQLVDLDNPLARAGAAALAGRWTGGTRTLRTVHLGDDRELAAVLTQATAPVVVWAGPERLQRVAPTPTGPAIYLSDTVLQGGADRLLGGFVDRGQLVHRTRLATERDPALKRFAAWAKGRQVDVTHARLQAEGWFAMMALRKAMKHVDKYPQRDFVLDSLDHAAGLTPYLPIYPKGSFGPGQRLVSKGAWLVPLADPSSPGWIVP